MATINGTTGNDTLSGTAGDDTLNGFEGNDLFLAGSTGGNDVINGGAGRDSIEFKTRATSAIVVDFVAGTITGGSSGTISFSSIERIVTGDFNDRLTGNAAGQTLTGQGGSDTIWGAGGVDTLWGGTGGDSFVFRETGSANADGISDFASGLDKIVLDAAMMSALGASGNFAAGDARFVANSTGTAQDASDRIIYETDTRQVWYDADGTGAAARQLIATLQTGATLVATDIVVENGTDPGGGGTINGTSGNDSLIGTTGNDTIDALAGNDSVDGAGGSDLLIGGAGDDRLFGGTADPDLPDPGDRFVGGDGNDTLNGTESRAGAFADTMDGGLGDDQFHIDHAGDVLSDAGGVDTVFAYDMGWTLGPGFENLVLHNDVSESGDVGIGNELDNRISSSYAGSRLEGRGGNDTLIGGGSETDNELFGGEGNDSLHGAHNEVARLDGGVGNDTLTGGSVYVFSVAPGAANADHIVDFSSAALIELDGAVHANAGISGRFSISDERFAAGGGFTSGQDASDRVVYNTATGQLFYDADGNGDGQARLVATLDGAPALTARNIVIVNGDADGLAITGTAGNDSLTGSTGTDTIDGLAGNDTIRGVGGRDLLIGGDGNDFIIRDDGEDFFEQDFRDTLDGGLGDDIYDVYTVNIPHITAPNAVIVDAGGVDTVLATNWTLGPGLENFTLVDRPSANGHHGIGNELDNVMRTTSRVGGSAHGLSGSNGNDTLIGNAGADGLIGGAGDDWLDAGIDAGNVFERLIGGAGSDSFVFRQPTTFSPDHLSDFASTIDRLVFDVSGFTALGAPGQFTAADERFKANTSGTATDPSDRIIYNTASGELWYDADGSGSGAAVSVAVLEGAPTLAAPDIVVVGEGGSGGSEINGTAGPDTLDGTDGDDTIDGLGGNDLITGNQGADSLRGGSGNDTLIGGEAWTIPGRPDFIGSGRDFAVDTLDGGLGDDVYHVSGPDWDGDVIIADAGGIDTVFSWNSDWTLGPGLENLDLADDAGIASNGTGNELDNIILGSSEGGTLSGMGGNDLLVMRIAENTGRAFGGDGNDTLRGEGILSGEAGDDELNGGLADNATNMLSGGPGADRFVFDHLDDDPGSGFDQITDFASGIDTIRLDARVMSALGASGRLGAGDGRFATNSTGSAQDSSDRVIYNTASGELWYDADGSGTGAATLLAMLQGAPALAASDIEVVNGTAPGNVINGTAANDTLTGTAGDDTINGLGGNDLFVAGSTGGNDVIDGGAGRDSIEFKERATSAITVDFVSGTITGGSPGTVSFTNVERILTGNFDDTLIGNAGSQTLTGQGGSDTIAGAGGADTLWGATGRDVFIFREMGTANADRISDFASGSDWLNLDDAAFTAIGATGNFAAADARFKANATGTATDTNDRVVFNTSTGQLYYDADGSGSGAAAQLIATVQSGASVAATDIVVI